MDIKLPADVAKNIVEAAIFQAVGPEARNTLIEAAIKHLITPATVDGYGRRREESPLQIAFRDALERQAAQVANEIMQEVGVRDRIRTVLIAGLDAALSDPNGGLRTRLEKAVTDSLTRHD